MHQITHIISHNGTILPRLQGVKFNDASYIVIQLEGVGVWEVQRSAVLAAAVTATDPQL